MCTKCPIIIKMKKDKNEISLKINGEIIKTQSAED